MRTLFLKIFLGFWLAMVLAGIVNFVWAELARSAESGFDSWRELIASGLANYATNAVAAMENNGPQAAAAYLDHVQRTVGIRNGLFDASGKEVTERLGPDLPPSAHELVERALAERETEYNPGGRRRLVANYVLSSRGTPYVFLAEMPPPRFVPSPWPRILHLAIILISGGVFCFWLAHYITLPIVKLRGATQELAKGNLKARVGPTVTRRNDELAYLAQDFDVMASRIESLMTSQTRLLGDISHELRSPLARLNVALELARRRAGSEAAGALDRIEYESGNLNQLIGQLLTITRLESGAAELKNSSVELGPLVREIAEDTDFEARGRNVSVRVTNSDNCSTRGTPELIRSAVENALRNAVRYTAEGTEVEVGLECVSHNGRRDAVIRVRDHGPGVPAESLAHIFRPFYRVEDARDRQSGGTGLGLAITARAIELHGGNVIAENAPEGGLIIEMRLPLAKNS